MSRPSRRCPSLERGCFAYAVLAKTDVATTPGIPGYATIGLCQGAGTGTGEEAGGRGRGGRPRPPACPWRPRGRLRVHGAPGTSRPTMCDTGGPRLSRPSRRCPSLERGCFAYAVLAKTDVATTPGIPGYATIGLCQGAGTGTGEEAGGRGRGGRPRPPACPWRPRGRLRVHGAPGTSRPTMCADMARSLVGADVLGRPPGATVPHHAPPHSPYVWPPPGQHGARGGTKARRGFLRLASARLHLHRNREAWLPRWNVKTLRPLRFSV